MDTYNVLPPSVRRIKGLLHSYNCLTLFKGFILDPGSMIAQNDSQFWKKSKALF